MSATEASPPSPARSSLLNAGVQRREVWAWAMYDFANSGYTTVVLTAVFNAYFVGVVAGNAAWATFAWTAALGLSNALVMVLMPGLGAYADLRAAKKRLLALATVGCVAATATLALVGPGDLGLAVAAIVLSNLCYAVGESLVAAFLPELAPPEAMGTVSGWGWSLGYCGGMLTLGLSLAWVLAAQARGQGAAEFVPVTMLITAAIYLLAALPTFLLLRERAQAQAAPKVAPWGASLARLRRTWQQARTRKDFAWLLACCASTQAGITVVIALAAVYAEQVLGFRQTQTMLLIFLVNIASALGAFGFGYGQDRIGHRRALALALLGWVVMVLLAYAATTAAVFWAAAVIAGLCMGSTQSAARAMAGLLAPPDRRAEFFALWTFAVRLAAVVGPLTYGSITWLSGGNHRLAILCTGVFFLGGLLLLAPIDMARGRRAAALEG